MGLRARVELRYYQVKHRLQAPTLFRNFDITHWFRLSADGRVDGRVITKISRMMNYQIFLAVGLHARYD